MRTLAANSCYTRALSGNLPIKSMETLATPVGHTSN